MKKNRYVEATVTRDEEAEAIVHDEEVRHVLSDPLLVVVLSVHAKTPDLGLLSLDLSFLGGLGHLGLVAQLLERGSCV